MRLKRLTLHYIIPSILVLYTVTMVMIQLGIPNKDKIPSSLEEPVDLDLEGSYIGQRLIFQYRTGTSEFGENIKIHDLDETLDSEKEPGNSPRRKSDFKKVGSINVFSVYLDNRIKGFSTLVVIALQKVMETDSVMCHFHRKNGSYMNVSSKSYEMCENHSRAYGGWMYFCTVPIEILKEYARRNRTLTYIALSTTSNNNKLIKVKITDETVPSQGRESKKFSLGICVPPLFGEISISLLVQFIELSKILGFSHFTFYNHEISESIYKLLRFYDMRKEATIINWKLPDQIMDREIWYHGQLLAIQDCLYRNMAHTKYLAFLDIDEFIIPVINGSLPHVINTIRDAQNVTNATNIAGFSFKSAFFAPNQVLDPSQQLTYLQLLRRTSNLSNKRTKLIVQPDRVVEVGIHHISKTINDSYAAVMVNPQIAKIHHYRACVINYEPEMNCFQESRDANVLKYSKTLVRNYKNVIKRTLPLFMPKQRWKSTK